MTISSQPFFSKLASSNPQQEEGIREVCIPNISPLERKKRMKFGVQQLVITLVVLVVLIVLGVNPLWRLPLFFMFSAGTTSCFQALDKT
ncbi:MAG: hypothetical protein QM730_09820 [Anaerolineales bacterium]